MEINLYEQIEMMEASKKDKRSVLDWLFNVRYLIETLGNEKYFDKRTILLLIKYEMEGKKRRGLIKRLHGRFGRLRQRDELKSLMNNLYISKH